MKKGFTLIELLGIIIILGIIITISFTTFTSSTEKTQKLTKNDISDTLCMATETYITATAEKNGQDPAHRYYDFVNRDSATTTVDTDVLVEKGYVKSSLVNDIESKNIIITKENGTVSCSKLEISNMQNGLYVQLTEVGTTGKDSKGNKWHKDRATIIGEVPNYKNTVTHYKFDTKEIYLNSKSFIKYSASEKANNNYTKRIEVTQTGTYYFGVKDTQSNFLSANLRVNIDKNGPIISEFYHKAGTLELIGTAVDTESGLVAYQVSTNANLTASSAGWTTLSVINTSKSFSTKVYKNGTYYFYAKDSVGNISKKELKLIDLDVTPPTCTLSTEGSAKNSSGWKTGEVTVRISYKDNDGGTGVDTYGLTTSASADYNKKDSLIETNDTNGKIYYGYVKDKVGNVGTCTTNVYKDSTKPVLNGYLYQVDVDGNGVEHHKVQINSGVWVPHTVKRVLVPSDNMSGIDHTEYRNEENGSWNKEYNVSSWYHNNLRDARNYRTIDKAGNISDNVWLDIRSDFVVPTFNVTGVWCLGGCWNMNWWTESSGHNYRATFSANAGFWWDWSYYYGWGPSGEGSVKLYYDNNGIDAWSDKCPYWTDSCGTSGAYNATWTTVGRRLCSKTGVCSENWMNMNIYH